MNINHPNVTYSSIVKIGEQINKLEQETNSMYLKLHRGVMDVTTIDLNSFDFYKKDLNSRLIQQYSANDGLPSLINIINKMLGLGERKTLITTGGMSSLDLVINSLSDEDFYVPFFHWGSWSKILKIHNKNVLTYDEFNLNEFRPNAGVVMLCFPSNPTGFMPTNDEIKGFLNYAKYNNVTVILDLPYYHLFNEFDSSINEWLSDNVILVSSFSKSIGLSGFRIGYVTTSSNALYEAMRIRSLYKYNSISVLPQILIKDLLEEHYVNPNNSAISKYKETTIEHINKNIDYLVDNDLLFNSYPSKPMGPFAVVRLSFDDLLEKRISSVPMSKFNLNGAFDYLSRISVAVNHNYFVAYFNN
jgi:aspartate/methionine/tyrosine aminotransferase